MTRTQKRMEPAFHNKVALITGASRGIGAKVAEFLAQHGADVIINYRSKTARAADVATTVESYGVRAVLAQADVTQSAAVEQLVAMIRHTVPALDILILNASGGLEKDKPASYAMTLNRDAQVYLLEQSLPILSAGSTVVFVTSHWAHFYGQRPVYVGYEPIAASKRAGEDALRRYIPQLTAQQSRLLVVSGDMIDGTITPKLLERQQPGLLHARRAQGTPLPTIDEFARAIVASIRDSTLQSGDVIFVGTTEV
jgi:3-oxoacyl-[acyl-carrier protein] reductase